MLVMSFSQNCVVLFSVRQSPAESSRTVARPVPIADIASPLDLGYIPRRSRGATMGKLSISLPDDMNAYVERRVEEGAYADASAFVHALIRQDRESRPLTMDELRERLERAEASGTSERTFPEIMEEGRRRARERGLLP
jgi:antitoxin ParD1/3/4